MGTALDERYGRTRGRRRRGVLAALAGAALLGVAVLSWALWTGVGGAGSTLDVDTVGSSVVGDDATTVRWQVTGRPAAALICAVEARDAGGVVVGLVEERVDADGRGTRSGTTAVRTVRRAATGLIVSCRDA